MPYIKQSDRGASAARAPRGAGELNYAFTVLIVGYLTDNGLSYQSINDVVGALEGAKAEFQRRVVKNYEIHKIEENGDVYPPGLVSQD